MTTSSIPFAEAELVHPVTGLEGDLAEVPLGDLLMMLSLTRRTARVRVNGDAISGTLWVGDGAVLHGVAVVGIGPSVVASCAGDGALERMLQMERGVFRVHYGVAAPERSMFRVGPAPVIFDEVTEPRPAPSSRPARRPRG